MGMQRREELTICLREMIALPVYPWPDDGTTYPRAFCAELIRYRNKRIIELENELSKQT